jgi:hypothetical protein
MRAQGAHVELGQVTVEVPGSQFPSAVALVAMGVAGVHGLSRST